MIARTTCRALSAVGARVAIDDRPGAGCASGAERPTVAPGTTRTAHAHDAGDACVTQQPTGPASTTEGAGRATGTAVAAGATIAPVAGISADGCSVAPVGTTAANAADATEPAGTACAALAPVAACLLYTSDAADE